MWFRCKHPNCKREWKAHDSSNTVKEALCRIHQETERIRQNMPVRRGPTRPFDDYNPRPSKWDIFRQRTTATR
jgi:hypothetical protein